MVRLLTAILLLPIATALAAPPVVPSDGTDGILNLTGNGTTTIDLSLAESGNWDTPISLENSGKGIYDPKLWVVVYKYQSVTIGTGRTVNFKNHPTGAPVVWLVQGDVQIDGTLSLDANRDIPGPGGFAGNPIGPGYGPGGGAQNTAPEVKSGSGSYGTMAEGTGAGPTYGNSRIFPLIGGSGGAKAVAVVNVNGGGAGGGAILIATSQTINIEGLLVSRGSHNVVSHLHGFPGGGAGGGIRLIADRVTGQRGTMRATGGQACHALGCGYVAGDGRIRIEANEFTMTDGGLPGVTLGPIEDPHPFFPDPTTPVIRSIRLGDKVLPLDPKALTYTPDLVFSVAGDYDLEIEAFNVPEDATMEIRVTPSVGSIRTSNAAFVSGNIATSIWRGKATLPDGRCEIIARAILPTVAP